MRRMYPPDERRRQSEYDEAQVCPNGHVINEAMKHWPRHNKEYCSSCGEKSITICQQCNTPIQGKYFVPGVFSSSTFTPPKFCYICGKRFPWTEIRMSEARALIDLLDELNQQEKDTLEKSIDDLVRETPRTQTATIKFKSLMRKVGSEAGDALKAIIVDILSEAAKKAIFPGN